MTAKTLFSFFIIVLLNLANTFAQQSDLPVPELVSEYSVAKNNCEYAMALTDDLIRRLSDNPNTQGYAVIYGDPLGASVSRRREKELLNYLSIRGFDRSRITIAKGPVRSSAVVQLWMVPPGASDPEILPANAEFQPEKPITDAYIWAIDSADGLPECRQAFDLKEFAAILNADITLRANIVIRVPTAAEYRKKEREMIGVLVSEGVSRSRLRSSFVKVRRNQMLDYTELWLVPAKSR